MKQPEHQCCWQGVEQQHGLMAAAHGLDSGTLKMGPAGQGSAADGTGSGASNADKRWHPGRKQRVTPNTSLQAIPDFVW